MAKSTYEIGSEHLVKMWREAELSKKNNVHMHKQKLPCSEIWGLVSLKEVLRTFLFPFERDDSKHLMIPNAV